MRFLPDPAGFETWSCGRDVVKRLLINNKQSCTASCLCASVTRPCIIVSARLSYDYTIFSVGRTVPGDHRTDPTTDGHTYKTNGRLRAETGEGVPAHGRGPYFVFNDGNLFPRPNRRETGRARRGIRFVCFSRNRRSY